MLRVTKRMKKRIIGVGAIALAVVIAGGAILSSTQTALAADATLPGIEETVKNNSTDNPFVILEVIPDKPDATLGLLIGGEEPVGDDAKSIKDMPSAEERENHFSKQTLQKKIGMLGIENALSYANYLEYDPKNPGEEAPKSVEFRGTFYEVANGTGDYGKLDDGQLYQEVFFDTDPNINDGVADEFRNELIEINDFLYRKHWSYRLPQETGAAETYAFDLKEIPAKDLNTFMPIELEDEDDVYNNQFFVIREEITENTVLEDGDMIFKVEVTTTPAGGDDENGEGDGTGDGDENGEGAEAGAGTTVTEEKLDYVTVADADTKVDDYKSTENATYVIVEEADGNNIDDNTKYYYISSVDEDDENGAFIRTEEYVIVDRPEGGYQETGTEGDYVFLGKTYYIYDQERAYEYKVNQDGDHNFTADYRQPVYDVARYTGGVTNYEWFKQHVFDLTNAEEYAGMSIDVVPITYTELLEKLQPNADGTQSSFLENVDLLYFGGCIHDEENKHSIGGADEGVNINATRMLLNAVKGGMPTIMNRSVYETGDNSLLVRVFAAAVMQQDISKVDFAALFPEDADGNNPLDLEPVFNELKNTMVKPLKDANGNDTTLTYVRGNLYVHDDVYVKQEQNNPTYVVSSMFASDDYFSDAQIDGITVTIDGKQEKLGFRELLEEIETENFYLENAGVRERIPEEATIATAIRHILNYGNRRNVTKSTLSVLDLEPADFEEYYANDLIDFDDREAGQDGIPDVYQDIHVRGLEVDESIDFEIGKIQTDSICIKDGRLDYTGWLMENLVDPNMNPADINVEILGTREFIGRIDDLNEKYDLIYLGMDTSIMNTNITGDNNDYKSNVTDYNDGTLNGLVYSHIGDSFDVISDYDGNNGVYRQSGNDITPDKRRELEEYIKAGYAVLLSDEMLEIGNDGKWKVNATKIDSSSNMYKLLDEVVLAQDDGEYLYFGKNVNTKANVTGNPNAKSTFNSYLNISKLRLEYEPEDLPIAWANPYNEETGQYEPVYLEPDANGVYHLDFKIKLVNDAAVGVAESNYNCQLYIDVDANGRYDPDEVLTGLTIYNGDKEISIGNDGRFHLEADKTYTISRELPEEYTGFISWKLVFTQNDVTFDYEDNANSEDSVVRCSVFGYSAVPAPEDQRPTINILQITTHDSLTAVGNQNDNLNLDSTLMRKLYGNVQDFDIHITRISSDRFLDKNPGSNGHEPDDNADDDDIFYANADESYIDYLNRFDMVVLGFADQYNICNGIGIDRIGGGNGRLLTEGDVVEAMLAIREYALSGRSIMFTHDVSSSRFDYLEGNYGFKAKGWYANRILRDIQGMDRYGWMERVWEEHPILKNVDLEDPRYKYDTHYDEPNLKGAVAWVDNNIDNDIEINPYVGLTDPLIASMNYKGNNENIYENWLGGNARNASWYSELIIDYSVDPDEMIRDDNTLRKDTTTIAQVNSGQITEYPYVIPKSFEVTFSHPQYMQLNLETDSRDEFNDDIVVWYTLSDSSDSTDSYYRAYEKDVRNNYYIFNKGNVTYTGSGDTWNQNNEMEMKLFVNTLVASYRTGVHAPRATFKESELLSSATIDNMYVPYDPVMEDVDNQDGSFLEEDLTVFFYTSNVDLQQSSNDITAMYYIKGTEEDYTVKINDVPYKAVTPSSLKYMADVNGTLTPIDVTNMGTLANNTMYVATFDYGDINFGRNAVTGLREGNSTDIYVRLGYGNMVNIGEVSLSAAESISGLHVMSTQLFELR